MPTIYDTNNQAYLLEGDIMKEIEKDPEYYDYYNQFNRMEDINIDPDGDVWVNVSEIYMAKDVVDSEQYEIESWIGLLSPFIAIGCKRFKDTDYYNQEQKNRQTLLEWLMGNEKLKPILEKKEQEIKTYYDRQYY